MLRASNAEVRQEPLEKKLELEARLERITANLRRGYDSDSQERAKQMEDNEVVDALGNEARAEIGAARLSAYPYADECIDCARIDEYRRAH